MNWLRSFVFKIRITAHLLKLVVLVFGWKILLKYIRLFTVSAKDSAIAELRSAPFFYAIAWAITVATIFIR